MTGEASQRPNFENLGGGTYLCRTQAGFKQAAKHWTQRHGLERKVCGPDADWFEQSRFPTAYPAIVRFSDTRFYLTNVTSWSGRTEVETYLKTSHALAARELEKYSELIDSL